MAFKRYDGYVMNVPQKFIDQKLPVCPFCGSPDPHWLLESKMEFSLAGSRTYYQCERCRATLSSTAADAGAEDGRSFRINPAMAGLNAAQKGSKHQEVGVAYLRVDSLGQVCTRQELLGQEQPITYYQQMISQAQQPAQPVYQQPVYQQPMYQQPAQPVYQQPVYQQPVYQQPVYQQPYYPQPQQAYYPQAPMQAPANSLAEQEAPGRFPAIALIMASLLFLFDFFSTIFDIGWYGAIDIFCVFFGYIAETMLIAGLAILGKKRRNPLFAAGCIVLAVVHFIAFLYSLTTFGLFDYYYFDYYYFNPFFNIILPNFIAFTCLTVIGISYMISKPGTMILKNIFAGVYIGGRFLCYLGYLSGGQILKTLLLYILPLALAVFFYSPASRKQSN